MRIPKKQLLLAILILSGCSIRPLYNYEDAVRSCDIEVDVIAEREGQKLRSHLVDTFRDIRFLRKKYILTVKLSSSEKQFAFSEDGNVSRLMFSYTAEIALKNSDRRVLLEKNISVSTSYNVSHAQGSVTLSLYGRNNDALIKELSDRIVENIRVFTESESRV